MKFKFKPAEIGKFATKDAEKTVKDLEKNAHIIGMTFGMFSLIDIIHCVLKKTGPARVVTATWSAGIKDVHQVKWMVDTNLITDFKLLTDQSYKNRQRKYAASIEDLFGIENIRTSRIHAKFTLIQNNGWKVSIISSMNLNANKTCELFEIVEGNQPFDFLMDFVITHFDDLEPGFTIPSEKVLKPIARFFGVDSLEEQKHWSESLW